MNNIYYSPEKFGLEVVAELSKDLSYEFDIYLVWKDKDGRLFTATDSGCSCPTPFEDHNIETIEPIVKENFENFKNAIKEWNDGYESVTMAQLDAFLSTVEANLNNNETSN